jgi:hypothetical protein
MFGNIANSSTVVFPAVSATDTAAATSSWVLVTNYEGAVLVTQNTGVVTAGTIVGAIQTATDDSGTSSAAVVSFTSVSTATDNAAQTLTIQCNALKPYIRYVGTITTGPAVVGVSLIGTPKY